MSKPELLDPDLSKALHRFKGGLEARAAKDAAEPQPPAKIVQFPLPFPAETPPGKLPIAQLDDGEWVMLRSLIGAKDFATAEAKALKEASKAGQGRRERRRPRRSPATLAVPRIPLRQGER